MNITKYLKALGSAAAIAGLQWAASAAPVSAQVCYDFEDLPVGTSYEVGDVVTTPDTTTTLNQFQWSNGLWTDEGVATVVPSNNALGSGSQELNLNNINMRVFGHVPPGEVRFRYADLGGNVNFGVNGDFVNVGNLSALDGTVQGGCLIEVVWLSGPSGESGRVRVSPLDVQAAAVVAVGGQEFYVDDFCHQ
ncbi:MAG: hypothetical protein OXR73_06965 [Myxococcales bacterium]|nr:hypothetical protein [Myxococcales bacterium]